MTQSQALDILKTGANVFLTGEPGSGKTHTVNAYVRWLRSHAIEPSITASTGIAATHIHGMTIHSWSGLGIINHMTPHDLDRIAGKEHVAKRIQKTHVLIIDEISMLSGEVLEMVDEIAREVRHSSKPFGGIQVVLVGDFFQLPPVSRANSPATFAFESRVWAKLNPLVCYLTEQHRQDDKKFLSILSAIRSGEWDDMHVVHLAERQAKPESVNEDTPRLFTHNVDVDRINSEKLASLPGKAEAYRTDRSGAPTLVEGLLRGCLSPELLELKVGAVVMCTKNNPSANYVNGTLGVVTGFERGTRYPIIETRSGARELTIAAAEWAVEENGKVRAKITQIPLRLAWAITVHKSQGMSMDAAAMDLSKTFEYGQGYVALSRVRRLSGLHLLGWSEKALSVHPEVARVDADFHESSEVAEKTFDVLEGAGDRLTMEENFIRACGGSLVSVEPGTKGAKAPKRSTYEETLTLVQAHKSLEVIAKERGLTLGTICGHVEKLAENGRVTAIEVAPLLPERLTDGLPEIHEAFRLRGTERLAPVFSELDGMYSYDDLALARILFVK